MEIRYEDDGDTVVFRLELIEWSIAGGLQAIQFKDRLEEMIPESRRAYDDKTETWRIPVECENLIRELAKEVFSPKGQQDVFDE